MQRSIKPTKKETDHQGPDFDDLKISEKWSIKLPKNI
jgi:hypothetical protein